MIKLRRLFLRLQTVDIKLSRPDGRVDPGGRSFKFLINTLGQSYTTKSINPPSYGVVTWQSEGAEGGPYHRRKLHVPSSASGLTIGRGYDLKQKPPATINSNLTLSHVSVGIATVLSKASKLHGDSAKKFIIENDLLDFEVSTETQLALFKLSYEAETSEVKRICGKKGTVEGYGAVDWENLDLNIKDVVIDLKFRGDYTPLSRKLIQKHISNNDLKAVSEVMINKSNWPSVPVDRFNRRKKFLENIKVQTTIKKEGALAH